MDRVRIGLSGLGAVFLLTLGVSLTFGGPETSTKVAESEKGQGEPLAQLGVAPGSEKQAELVVPPQAPEGYRLPETSQDQAEPSESPVRTAPGQPVSGVSIAT